MGEQMISVPWGKDEMKITLPANWEVMGRYEPAAIPLKENVRKEIEQALSNPIEMDRIGGLVRPGMRIAIVIDDGSRPTPIAQVIPPVIDELTQSGVSLEMITVVPAIGVHRGMEEKEFFTRIGNEYSGSIRWENHNCDDPDKMVYLGETSRNTPVWINKTVAQADLVISIGCIEPHIIASFGGGYKNIVPGVAGRITIAHNHTLNCAPQTFNMVGQPIDHNPMRLDLEEAASLISGKVFIINTILNYQQKIVGVVAGHPIAAHRQGVRLSGGMYGIKLPQMADIVITDSHPMDQDLRQGVKALANTVRAVRPGGVLITLVRAEEGTGVFGLANKKLPLGKNAMQFFAPILLKLIPKLKLKGVGEEDKFFLYFAIQAMRRATLLMYASTIPTQVKERLVFVSFLDNPEQAISYAARKLPGRRSVVIFPQGGITYPVI